MNALLSYGEVLIDFLPGNDANSYYPMAGGAPANVAVAYAKLGQSSYFAGGISTDHFGTMLMQQLADAGVKTDYVGKFNHANTALVLVTLDANGERSFNFYRHNTADTHYDKTHLDNINWHDIGIFHFCSNTLTSTSMHDNTLYAIAQATAHQALISFDVNLRQQLWPDLSLLPDRVEAGIKASDIVKLSREEAEYLALQANIDYQQYLANLIAFGVKLVVITDGPDDVQVCSSAFSKSIPVPVVQAVDTTAAGDSFIAGFLCSLTQQSSSDALITAIQDEDKVTTAVLFAARCGAFTCQKKGAFAALPAINNIKLP